jgi:nucleotide-binding universal stress UspA family protein
VYKSVLVATDLLPTSHPALRAGLQLAQEQGSKLGVLYVVEVWMVERQWFTRITEEDIAFHRALLKREEEAALRAVTEQIRRISSEEKAMSRPTLSYVMGERRSRSRRRRPSAIAT